MQQYFDIDNPRTNMRQRWDFQDNFIHRTEVKN